jgi:hypothetical protein
MKDALFWTKLAYSACGWLRDSEDASLRRFWIDDFLPESATDTKRGVDVEGTAWVGDGPRDQYPYSFIVSVPQKMLHRRSDSFLIERFVLDEVQHTLQMEISNEKYVV